MKLTATRHKYIELNEEEVPYIAGTTMKVIELVSGHIDFGWSPEEIKFQHPYLSMSQIHSALAYYWDNKEALDADMQQPTGIGNWELGIGTQRSAQDKIGHGAWGIGHWALGMGRFEF